VSLEEEVALLLRQFHCKQQRIYKALPWRAPSRETRATGLATGAARSGIGDPPVKKSRPKAALCVIACMCGAMERRGTLMQTPGALGPRAQFQPWIFSYTVLARSSKKWLSRLKIEPAGHSKVNFFPCEVAHARFGGGAL
jgi:hypothetical protein